LFKVTVSQNDPNLEFVIHESLCVDVIKFVAIHLSFSENSVKTITLHSSSAMPPIKRKRSLIYGLVSRLLAGILMSSLFIPGLVFAEEERAPSNGRSAAGRGCGTEKAPATTDVSAIILLIPQQQPGQSTSTRPTFAWYIRDAEPQPIVFRLYEIENHSFKLVKEIKGEKMTSSPGIMVLPPSALDVQLAVGKRYRWQVELNCNSNRPSSNLLAQAELEVVALPADLKQELRQHDDRLKQAKLYQQANLWHDALGVAFAPNETNAKFRDLQLSLLNQVAINAAERQYLGLSMVQPVLLKSSQIGIR
jgi:hypothetical protein